VTHSIPCSHSWVNSSIQPLSKQAPIANKTITKAMAAPPLLFDKYIECYGGNLISIDIDPKACQLSRNATTEALVIQRDSVEALGEMEGRVDLLYLDSYNIDDWNNDWAPARPSPKRIVCRQKHHPSRHSNRG
jgi:hypothetical protein